MEILIKTSAIQFKNPIIGQPSRTVEEHYYARRIIAIVNGEERHFRFMSDELPYFATEDNMIVAIQNQIESKQG